MTKRVLIYRSDWLRASEGFVADHALHLKRYKPLTLGLRAPPATHFPPPDLWAAGGPHPSPLRRYAFRAFGLGLPHLPDIALIHAHFASDALDVLPLARRLNVPLVVTLHGYDVGLARNPPPRGDGLHWRWKRRQLMAEAAHFLPVSHWLRDEAERAGFPPAKLKLHYLGTPRPMPVQAPRSGILFAGRLVPSKGLVDLIEALAPLADRPLLTVIGTGSERAPAEARARALGVPIRFLGALPPDRTRALMAASRLLVLPARREAFGLVLIEAQALGTPVVAYAEAGPLEAVTLGGRLVPPGDTAALSQAIAAILADDILWQQLSEGGRRDMAARFDIARRTARLEELYDTCRRS